MCIRDRDPPPPGPGGPPERRRRARRKKKPGRRTSAPACYFNCRSRLLHLDGLAVGAGLLVLHDVARGVLLDGLLGLELAVARRPRSVVLGLLLHLGGRPTHGVLVHVLAVGAAVGGGVHPTFRIRLRLLLGLYRAGTVV